MSNTRTDEWGGNEEGHTRFTREVVDAVVEASVKKELAFVSSRGVQSKVSCRSLIVHVPNNRHLELPCSCYTLRHEDAEPSTNVCVPSNGSA
jgi:hypothetical protein